METRMIDLNLLPIETLKEMANDTAEQVEKNAKLTVQKAIDCGRYLTAIKEQLEHGKWGAWLGANWNYSQKTAAQYMQISNFTCGLNLKDAKSINDALRMIADDKAEKDPDPPIVPRAERKPADVKVSIPDNDPEEDYDDVGTVDDYPEGDFGPTDPDPAPDPPTIRKTAKGSENVPEAKKPKTAAIVPEIVDEPEQPAVDPVAEWIRSSTIDVIVSQLIERTENQFEQKKTAKALRKWADKLDPPEESQKSGAVPTIGKLIRAIPEEVGGLRDAIELWARHKQSLAGKSRVRSMESWDTMIQQMLKALSVHGILAVSESIRSSIANGYTGWDIQLKANGKGGNGPAYRGNGRGELTAEDVFSAESLGRRG